MNLCSRNSPCSLNCHVGAVLVFRMLCRITQSSDAHRTESLSVMDHEQTVGASSRVLDQKQQNIFGRISLFSLVSSLWSPIFRMKLVMVVHVVVGTALAIAVPVAVSVAVDEYPVMYLLAGNPFCAFSELQGSHASLKVLEFFSPKFKALKVLENSTGA